MLKLCGNCGAVYESERKNSRYCSSTCRSKQFRQRRKESSLNAHQEKVFDVLLSLKYNGYSDAMSVDLEIIKTRLDDNLSHYEEEVGAIISDLEGEYG
jgi:predicted  nucleic acid-binding Zn-ribbon protein